MADLTAAKLGICAEKALVASTGVIGVHLPIGKIRPAIPKIKPTSKGGHNFCRAIMTDTRPKEIAARVDSKEGRGTVGGVAKSTARDGEGATKLIEVTVKRTEDEV